MLSYIPDSGYRSFQKRTRYPRTGAPMTIQIEWCTEVAELSSTTLVGEISREYNIPLIAADAAIKKYQTIVWEVDGLDAKILNHTKASEYRTVAHILCLIKSDLRIKGVIVNIQVDGLPVLHYAAKQEEEVKKVLSQMKEATSLLKRSWFQTPMILKALRALG